jgi:hypothetical protein
LVEEQAKEAGPPPRLRAAILGKYLELLASNSRCLACRCPDPECGGTWILGPEEAAGLGLPPGLAPVFVYRICSPCAEKLRAGDPETTERVESFALANYSEDRATFVPMEDTPDRPNP